MAHYRLNYQRLWCYSLTPPAALVFSSVAVKVSPIVRRRGSFSTFISLDLWNGLDKKFAIPEKWVWAMPFVVTQAGSVMMNWIEVSKRHAQQNLVLCIFGIMWCSLSRPREGEHSVCVWTSVLVTWSASLEFYFQHPLNINKLKLTHYQYCIWNKNSKVNAMHGHFLSHFFLALFWYVGIMYTYSYHVYVPTPRQYKVELY